KVTISGGKNAETPGTAASFVPQKPLWELWSSVVRAFTRSPRGLDETPQVRKGEGRLKPPFAGNVGIPLVGARRLISRARKARRFFRSVRIITYFNRTVIEYSLKLCRRLRIIWLLLYMLILYQILNFKIFL